MFGLYTAGGPQVAAGAANHILRGTDFHELEAIAEGVSLPNQSEHFDFAVRQRELQANHFADRNFDAQQGRNSRFADVDGVAANHRAVARIDTDLDFELEPGADALLDHLGRLVESASLPDLDALRAPLDKYVGLLQQRSSILRRFRG